MRHIDAFFVCLFIVSGCTTNDAVIKLQPQMNRKQEPAPIRTLLIFPSKDTVRLGASMPIGVEVIDSNGFRHQEHDIIWSSSNPDIAIVDEAGIITGKAPGTAEITAATQGKHTTAVFEVIEVIRIPEIRISPFYRRIKVQGASSFSAVCIDSKGRTQCTSGFVWKTKNPRYLLILNGTVFGMSAGRAHITAFCYDHGLVGKAIVDVSPASP